MCVSSELASFSGFRNTVVVNTPHYLTASTSHPNRHLTLEPRFGKNLSQSKSLLYRRLPGSYHPIQFDIQHRCLNLAHDLSSKQKN